MPLFAGLEKIKQFKFHSTENTFSWLAVGTQHNNKTILHRKLKPKSVKINKNKRQTKQPKRVRKLFSFIKFHSSESGKRGKMLMYVDLVVCTTSKLRTLKIRNYLTTFESIKRSSKVNTTTQTYSDDVQVEKHRNLQRKISKQLFSKKKRYILALEPMINRS